MSGVLILNASYEILGVIGARRALMLVLTNHAEMLEERPNLEPFRSTGGLEIPQPSVVRLLRQINWSVDKNRKEPPLTRSRVFARDRHVCQVVGCKAEDVTLDHVIPKSQGGENSWENLVSMCKKHNHQKSDKSLAKMGWKLKKKPVPPQGYMLNASKIRPEWEEYIKWNKGKVVV